MLIVDLDGTIADNSHRTHLLPGKGEGSSTYHWARFNKACTGDKLILANYRLMDELAVGFGLPVFLSGRGEHARAETEWWLNLHGMGAYDLYLRPDEDHRKAADYKKEMFQLLVKQHYARLHRPGKKAHRIIWEEIPREFVSRVCVMEDDPKCAEIANKLGFTVVLVPSLCAAVVNDKSQEGKQAG